MGVERRLSGYSGMRIDWPHLRAIESSVSHDFDMLTRGLMTGLNHPYLVRGFRIRIPTSGVQASALVVEVADSVLMHSSATESGTILQVSSTQPVETLNAQNARVIGSFQANAINYVSLDYRRSSDPDTVDQTAGWSPSQQLEFQRAVPIGRILDYRFIITTNGFSTNLPLYIVKTTTTGAVDYITKAADGFFRLGKGGANPDPSFNFAFGNLTNTQPGANPRREWVSPTPGDNPQTVRPGTTSLAFDYGDWSIKSLKEWMDAVMTRFKEVTNSEYWYFGSGLPGGGGSGDDLNLLDLYFDSIGSVMTGTGEISYNLVLESTIPLDGRFQDSTVEGALPGDIYVEGKTSGTKATLTTYNATRLIINSLTSAAFVYDEELWTRRLFRPTHDRWVLSDYSRNSHRYGSLSRVTTSGAVLPNNISSWSFSNVNAPTAAVGWTRVTVNTAAPHGLQVGDLARVEGLLASGSTAPNGVHRIVAAPLSTSIVFITNVPQSGTPTVAVTNGAVSETQDGHPYTPSFKITAITHGSGTEVRLAATNHNLRAPQSLTADFTSASNLLQNVSATSDVKLGMKVYSPNFAAGFAYVLRVDEGTDEVEVSAASTATVVADTIDVRQVVLATGIHSTLITDNDFNGEHDVVDLGPSGEIVIDPGTASGTLTADADATAELEIHGFFLTITEASPQDYNVVNVQALAIAGDTVQLDVGSDLLPSLGSASGPYQLDGVIAESSVMNPVRVSTITNDGAGNLTVTTYVDHEQVTGGPVDFTIYGNSQLSDYIRSYKNVTISVISPTIFEIQGTGIISGASYTNPGTDNTFVRFSDNPYAGPVQWSSDIVVKGVIGDISLTIPQTAVVDMSDPDVSPTANQFNVNGQTGTAYLQDGEVLFVKLERNKSVSNGTIFSTAGGDSIIATSSVMTDEDGNPLVPGDFIKWADEAQNYWLKIKTINPTAVTLETDRGQAPDTNQRPAKSGKVMYTKGSYPLVYVKKHWLVDSSASTYWLAIRRDNDGSIGKVYFRSLEIEAGEVRQINDNQVSNLLRYTGAFSESAVNPNYTQADTSGDFQYTTTLSIESVDNLTRQVTFASGPAGGFQADDRFVYYDGSQYHYYTVRFPMSSRTVIVNQDTSDLAALLAVTYYRENQFIEDQDNLTLAQRKEDRQAGHVDTALRRPVYDESVYVQQINLLGAGTVRSGSYVYKGPIDNPTALAWVLHGNVAVSETIESATITMPGGHSTIGASAILVNVVFGSFQHGDGLFQNGVATGRTVNNPGNPPFTAPTVYGDDSGSGVEMVLPPNRRTQVRSLTGFVSYGAHSFYHQSAESDLTGEELLVIVNDGVREARFDYDETFGGPKAKLRLRRSIPPNTRMRFRLLASYGSALVAKSADVTLQAAYNAGATIQCAAARPVEITSDNVAAGSAALIARGSIKLNGGPSQLGGIFNETTDQSFVIGNEADKPKESWTGIDAVKTHTSHSGSGLIRKTAAQVVTGAAGTIITASAITLTDNYSYRIQVKATARRSDGTFGVASFTLEGTFYRAGGTAQAAGTPISVINGADGDGTAYAVAFGLSGNDVVAVVFGTAGSTVQWALSIESQAVGVA